MRLDGLLTGPALSSGHAHCARHQHSGLRLLVRGAAGTAPRQVLRLCLEGGTVPLMGAALYAACEDVLGRDELFADSPLSASERETAVDVLMSTSA